MLITLIRAVLMNDEQKSLSNKLHSFHLEIVSLFLFHFQIALFVIMSSDDRDVIAKEFL